MSAIQPRRPAGVPTGGQFASKSQPAPGFAITADDEGDSIWTDPDVAGAEIERHAAQLSAQSGWEHKVTVDGGSVWVEFAAATHGGSCPDCGFSQQTGPAWDSVERGAVRGSSGDGQCGGCGRIGSGWVHSGALRLGADSDGPTLSEHASDFDALVAERRAEVVREQRSAVAARHAEVLDQLRAGNADGLDGSDTNPGSYVDGGQLITWAQVPGGAPDDIVQSGTILDFEPPQRD